MTNLEDSLETQAMILDSLREDRVKTVVLSGEAGVGKTWMAKKISNSASHNGPCYGAIWVVPKRNYEGKSLVEYIAIQLAVVPSDDEREEDDNTEMKQQEQEEDLENLKRKIQEKLKLMKSAKLNQKDAPGDGKGPYILVVLDDVDDKDYQKIYDYLDDLLRGHHFKILITKRGSEFHNFKIGENETKSYKMEFLSHVDSSSLLWRSVKKDVSAATEFERLSTAIGKSSAGRPGVIVMIAEAMNRVKDSELDIAVEEMASIIESADDAKLWQHLYQMLPSTLSKCCWHCRYLFLHHNGIHYNELITHWLLEGYFDHHDHIETAYDEAHHTLMELKGRGFLREKENSYITMESDALGVNDHRRDGLSGSAYLGVASVLNGRRWAGLGRVMQTDGMIKTSSKKRDEMSTLFIDYASFCREVSETFFQRIKRLVVLVILNPMFEELPSPLSEMKEIQVLVLRGCRLLKNVNGIQELTKLLVLEISGACKVKKICDDLFKRMEDLRSLNLSEIGIKWLPASLLNRSELRWLILRKCPYLERLYEDNILKEREAAKEEGVRSEDSSSLSDFSSIVRNFFGCTRQEEVSLAKLEVLDLSGSSSFCDIQVKISPLEKLQILNLSKTKIEGLPSLRGLGELTRLLLSDCPYLTKLPPLKYLLKLEILDFSKTTSLVKLQEDPQGSKADFAVLALPRTDKNKIPPKIGSLSHLLLSGWVDLPKLPSTRGYRGLEELNLSDAYILEEFEDKSFEHLKSLRRLILSNTKIKALPSLSQDSELRLLLLKNCKFLTKLENLSLPQKLEVLDLSGCSELVIARNDSFRGMSRLKTINLSETKIESLPQNCFPVSLRQLIIRNCPGWKDLPFLEVLEGLRNLEVLDLCGAKSLNDIELKFLRHMSKLRILNLSEIIFGKLPSLSHLTNLRELSLRGCSCEVSELDALKKLELLDLSGTKVESLPPLQTFNKLQQLLLGDCDVLGSLENLKSLTDLEVLDLSGTQIQEFPYEISDLTSLRKINLQNMKRIKEIDWSKIKYIPEEFNLGGCGSLSSEIAESSDRLSISICGTGFFQFLEENRNLWDTCFQKFHFSVWLPKNSDGRIYDLGDWDLLRDIESQGRIPHGRIPHDEEPGRYLEIHGSYSKSNLPGHVLEHADHISLMDDSSLEKLSELVKENLRSIKSCWLDRCTNISSIVTGGDDARASGKLDSLYLCNLSSLEWICHDLVRSEVFGGLKRLYIDCCPMLAVILPLSKLPKNLETLQIKFCEKMERLFKPDLPVECNLQTLDLLELPKLERIGVMMVTLRELKMRQCPKLKNLEEVLGQAKNLEILHMSYAAKLKTICSQEVKPETFKKLKQLKIERCPKLENLEKVLGEAENLEILHISYAAELKIICSQVVKPGTFKKLKQLKIEWCPKLENLEEVLEEAKNLEILHISYAVELKTICSREVKLETFKNLKQLKIEQCLKLENLEEVLREAENLEILHISCAAKLKTICSREVKLGAKQLKIEQCPKLENLGKVLGEAENLEILHISYAAELKTICSGKVKPGALKNLKQLKIERCPKLLNLQVLLGEAENLEILHISYAAELTTVSSWEVKPTLKNLKQLKIEHCPKLQNLEKVLGEAENLEILHISYAAELKTVLGSEARDLQNLKQLKIESCPQLKEVSPSSVLLPKLEILEINLCKSLKTIFRGSSVDSSLRRLRLCNLPSLSSTVFKVPPQCQVDSNCPNLQLSLSG